jgi:hypothetical protein
MTCMTTVMCLTKELQVIAQLVGVMPRGHLGVLPTTPLVRLGILLVQVEPLLIGVDHDVRV